MRREMGGGKSVVAQALMRKNLYKFPSRRALLLAYTVLYRTAINTELGFTLECFNDVCESSYVSR